MHEAASFHNFYSKILKTPELICSGRLFTSFQNAQVELSTTVKEDLKFHPYSSGKSLPCRKIKQTNVTHPSKNLTPTPSFSILVLSHNIIFGLAGGFARIAYPFPHKDVLSNSSEPVTTSIIKFFKFSPPINFSANILI